MAPGLGRVRLAELTGQHVQRWIDRLAVTGASARSVRRYHGALHTALECAEPAADAPDDAAATVRQAIGDGRIRATKRGRDWWVDPAEVVRYGRERRVV